MSTLNTSIRISLLDSFSAPLQKIRQALGSVDKQLVETGKKFQLAANLNQASEAMARFGATMRNVVERPFTLAANFDTLAVKIKNAGSLSAEAIAQVRDELKRSSVDLGYSLESLAEITEKLTAADIKGPALDTVRRDVVNVSKGGFMSGAQATDLLAGTALSFGLDPGKSSTHIADVLLAADSKSSRMDAAQLGDFLSRTGSTAASKGVSLETMSGIAATLADKLGGNRLTDASTAMINMMNIMANPNDQQRKGMQSIGLNKAGIAAIQTQAQKGDFLGAAEALNAQFDKFKVPELARGDVLQKIFGTGSDAATMRTLLENTGQARSLGSQFTSNVDGTAASKAAEVDNSTEGRMAKLRSQWDVLLVDLGERLTPTVMKLSETFTPLLKGAGEWIANNPDLVSTIAKVAVVFGTVATVAAPMLSAIASIVTIAPFVTGAVSWFAAGVAALGGPLTLAAVAVGAAIGFVIAHWDELGEMFTRVGREIKDEWNRIMDGLKKGLAEVWQRIKSMFGFGSSDGDGKANAPSASPALPGAKPKPSIDDVTRSTVQPLGFARLPSRLAVEDPDGRRSVDDQTAALTRELRANDRTNQKLLTEFQRMNRRGRRGLPDGGSTTPGGF